MFYHIKLMESSDSGEFKTDISEEELITRYIDPYLYGETIVINGTTLNPEHLWRVRISQSESSIAKLVTEIEHKDKLDRSPFALLRPSAGWRAIDELEDVTDTYINAAPGSKQRKVKNEPKGEQADPSKVFIVHGHDTELKNDVELFCRSINIEPIILHRELDEGLTIIEKFEKHSNVKYAIILLTPDDIGFSADNIDKNDEERKLELRARQNVIFEFGYFVGKLTRHNVCCIYKEGVILPSDLDGLIYKKVNKSVEEVGLFLLKELKAVGLNVKFE